ncbi:MAG: hypothetical protein J6J93_06245 [Muribaculaceae bacterium]|nr:hypothetical protein [Muribaculaceae bacterium]
MSDNKSTGGLRAISTVHAGDFAQNAADFRAALATGKYDIENSYLSDSGAYVLFEKGHTYHIEEIEAAQAMANHGINVIMENEGDPSRATAIDANNNYKFSEGVLAIERLSYEQSTRETLNTTAERSVKKALEHAKTKGSSVAVIYDRGGVFHRDDIRAGIKKYESFKNNSHRFRAIFVIDKYGNVYEWNHTKK